MSIQTICLRVLVCLLILFVPLTPCLLTSVCACVCVCVCISSTVHLYVHITGYLSLFVCLCACLFGTICLYTVAFIMPVGTLSVRCTSTCLHKIFLVAISVCPLHLDMSVCLTVCVRACLPTCLSVYQCMSA